MGELRIGKVSAVNYAAGTARILYSDKSGEVTKELPFLSMEYHMPQVDDMVVVGHLANGKETAVIFGRFWSGKNLPPEGKAGLYRKDMSRTAGKALIRYDEETGMTEIIAPNCKIQTGVLTLDAQSVEGNGAAIGFQGTNVQIGGTTVTISGGTVNITGAGDVVLDGISLKNHTHTCSGSGGQSSKAQ